MIGYVKYYDSNKTMSFKVIDNKLLKKYTKIWERVSSVMNIEFDSEPVYGDNDKYIKTKVNSYADKVNTNFQSNTIPKENESYKCLSLIMLDSVIRVSKKYYPQTLLEECKYKIKKNKMEKVIYDDLDYLMNLKMNVTVNLIMGLIKGLIMNLVMNLPMISLLMMNLKIKTVFSQ